MATLITYTDKEQGKVSTLPVTKKYRFEDANEVKTVVNNNAAETNTNTANIATNATAISNNTTALAGKEPSIAAGTAVQFLNGVKAFISIYSEVRATLLTGLSLVASTAITASDTLIVALGKLQKQVTDVNNFATENENLILGNTDNIALNTSALTSKADLVTGKVPLSQLPPILDIPTLTAITVAPSDSVLAIVTAAGVENKIAVSDLTNEYIRKAEHSVLSATTTQTINLSTTFSLNIIRVLNPGLTLTIQFPTNPVESQVCQFTTLTNTVTLIVGSGGSYTIDPSFAGAPVAGFVATYVYHETDNTWYKMG